MTAHRLRQCDLKTPSVARIKTSGELLNHPLFPHQPIPVNNARIEAEAQFAAHPAITRPETKTVVKPSKLIMT